ncbi:hypothetical protein Q361_11467 [Flavobacterium croceum DSM 17960]|uniref:Glycosyl transferase family 1 n=1 Tax=Flavobacterium croceum DSM 17960 TaxID=1121886 RepID=A0A2S4N5X6_9FLAO|nr:glycosyltransferase [Flavobacterium croceum]POS01121.1 hypothetical protein Q361_11467 [Flavobacterium croceum DSM 17960]
MKILFHENQLSYRGTSKALYDYAHYNEQILNNESIILYNKSNENNFDEAVKKFKNRFKVIEYNEIKEIDKIIEKEKVDLFYAIKYGYNDNIISKNCKTAIHTVFKCYEPHGDVYSYVSKWLSKLMTNSDSNYVPHIIDLPNHNFDLRSELNIPNDAIVFGRHGGAETFDIKFVQEVIKNFSRTKKKVYFLFLGTNSFVKRNIFRPYKNIIFLSSTIDEHYKLKFINTCDAYIHARVQGESFGIAIGEFSIKNKPIITWGLSDEKAHLEILQDKAIIYNNSKELINILENFEPSTKQIWDMYSEEFSPKNVMKKFKEIFINE